ncbi:MAG: hypothetical protein LBC38_01340, partial [Oscillospiraceae bacterium]|nr:hypothetical protein [Oscillospiraceae bacterium]
MKQRIINPVRVIFLVLLPVALAGVCVLAMYYLQIVQGQRYYEMSRNNVVTTEIVAASRGSIYDRYGRLLVGNRVTYNLALNREKLVMSGDPNYYLEKMLAYAEEFGVEYNADILPIDWEAPFDFVENMTETQRSRIEKYRDKFKLSDPNWTGAQLFEWLRTHYSIPKEMDEVKARKIVGIRWELELRTLFSYSVYYFAEDVGSELVAPILEQNFPGVSLVPVSVREYHTQYAAHLIGRVAAIAPEDLEKYMDLGYPLNAQVGKDGLEAAFESELHGTDGQRVITRNENGTITDMVYTSEPSPGNNVRLTVDIEMQQVAEQTLADTIKSINDSRDAKAKEKADNKPVQYAGGAAAVAIDVRTGDVLVSATYPTFDLETFSSDYAELSVDPLAPLINRAIQGLYEPGSTFKPLIAIAGLSEGKIMEDTVITCTGRFTMFDDYQPTCWSYPYSHGALTVVQAITQSCNIFFYQVGYELGPTKIARYAEQFGFGSKTGTELSEFESAGHVATEERKIELMDEKWRSGDTLQSAIGQSFHTYTPLQI